MNRKKRLCLLLPFHWSALMGGAEYQAKRLLTNLLATDEFEVHYVAGNCDAQYRPKGYHLSRIEGCQRLTKYSLAFDSFKLLKLLHQIKPDIIYQRVGCAYTGIAAYYASRHRCKMVWHIAHDDDLLPMTNGKSLRDVFRRMDKKILEYGVRSAHQIVAQSLQQKRYLEQHYNRIPAAVIRNFHPFPAEPISKAEPVKIMWIANLKPWKQPEYFIRLAKDLNNLGRTVECIMIGAPAHWAPDWQRTLEDQIDSTGHLSYMGIRSIDEINRLLAEAHILVNTSVREGFSNTFIQAWMRKVPVVSLNVDPDGVLQRHRIGFYCGSYEKMLERTIQLIDNRTLRDEMGTNAQHYAFSQHSEKNIVPLLEILRT